MADVDSSMQENRNKLKVLVSIMGARMHYAVPTALYKNGILVKHFTDFYVHPDGKFANIYKILKRIPVKIINRASTRYEMKLPESMVKSFPLLGILFSLSLQLSKSSRIRNNVLNYFYSKFSRKVGRFSWYNANLIYAINLEALELFEIAHRRKVSCVLEQVIVPSIIVNQLYEKELDSWSDWQDIFIEESSNVSDREKREWELAKGIICGSNFVINSLVSCGVRRDHCYLVPYAVDINKYKPLTSHEFTPNKNKLNILYIGSVDLRKGIQYLYQAVNLISSQKFTVKIAGGISIREPIYRQIKNKVEFLGLVSRSEIPHLLNWADVFVLPSICEGSAIAIYEALSAGLPVITTPNSGSVIRNEIDGFIVPIRDSVAIASKLEELYKYPELRIQVSKQARRTAEEYLSWDAYSDRLVSTLAEIAKL